MRQIPKRTGMFLITMCAFMSMNADPPPPHPSGQFHGPMDIIFPNPDPDGKEFERIAQELKLSKEQKDKTKALIERREKMLIEKSDKMPTLHEELRGLLEAEKVDLTTVRAKLQEISNNQLDHRMLQIQGRLEFESQLTSEQKQTFKSIHKKRLDTMRMKKGSQGLTEQSGCAVAPKK